MTVNVGINGFGRIGRCALSHIAQSMREDINVIKVNATRPDSKTSYFRNNRWFFNRISPKSHMLRLGRTAAFLKAQE